MDKIIGKDNTVVGRDLNIGGGKGGNKGPVIIACLGIIICAVLIIGLYLTPTIYVNQENPVPQTPVTPTVVYYTVSFETGGIYKVPEQLVEAGKAVYSPSIPAREGYSFDGWYTDSGYLWNFNNGIASNMVLTARWTPISSGTPSNVQGSVPPSTPVDSNSFAPTSKDQQQSNPVSTPVVIPSMPSDSTQVTDPVVTPSTPSDSTQVTDPVVTPSTPSDSTQVTDQVVTPSTTPSVSTPESTVIEISTTSEFLEIYNNPSGKYKLMADIRIPAGAIPEGSVFTGVLDGNGHTLVADGGNTILIPTTKFVTPRYYGLFGQNHGVIKDLTLSGFVVTMKDKQHNGAFAYTGIVCGMNKGTISDVHVISAKMTVLRMGASGFICGDNQGTIEDSSVTQGVLRARSDGGGITGHNNGLIRGCSVTGNGQGTSKEYEKYRFLFFDRAETGENAKQVQNWGGVCGYASSSSRISSTSVDQMHIYCFFRLSVEAHIGYFVGLNEGYIGDSCTLGAVEQKRNGNYSDDTVRYYLAGYYYGKNLGVVPSSW